MEIPIIVKVWIEGATNPIEIDAEIYCVNTTDRPFLVATRSTSFTTVDEEVGTAVHHGSRPVEILIGPGEATMVGDVMGWEWDGFVGMDVSFRPAGQATGVRASYNLGESQGRYTIEPLGKNGLLIAPRTIRSDPAEATAGPPQQPAQESVSLLDRLLRWLRGR
ncbi:MAG TPA: hypothetical protein VFS21_33755 [Roseiflexaceae bacterium]|nr:hypothetical protein [Roseiflexaceae bacterium]